MCSIDDKGESRTMKNSVEYQIFIGCGDYDLQEEIVSEDELREMVTRFFMRKEIDYSMFSVKGGYLREDGRFISENTLCISIIESDEMDIVRLARSLSMYMNQEASLVVKDVVKKVFC